MELKFKVDTKQRKEWFTGVSFSHPAKMSLPLQLWIIENYTKPGDTLLDPMAGSGTILVACSLGRNVIAVELEAKFIEIMKGNWERIKQRGPQLGYQMGECQIIQGDARNLENILVDHAIFSPPYALTGVGDWQTGRAEFQAWVISELAAKGYVEWQGKRYTESEWRAMNHGRIDGRTTKGVHKHPTDGYGEANGQIGNLPYGDIASIITSPPYAEAQEGGGIAKYGYQGTKDSPTELVRKYSYMPKNTGNTEGQISRLPYGSIDSVITSPPYEGSVSDNKESPLAGGNEAKYGRWKDGTAKKISYTQHSEPSKIDSIVTSPPYEATIKRGDESPSASGEDRPTYKERLEQPRVYSNERDNIGNLKAESYLSAMLQVYRQCHSVLRPGGLLILVTKNFIRNKKEVRLDEDTMKLCDQAGFQFVERHYRKLSAQSFWRVIYAQRYPSAPQLKYEDILVFVK